jgi:hypothetical protein
MMLFIFWGRRIRWLERRMELLERMLLALTVNDMKAVTKLTDTLKSSTDRLASEVQKQKGES